MSSLNAAHTTSHTSRLAVIAALAAAVLAVGLVVDPPRVWACLFCASFLGLSVSLFGPLFVALANICGARWHTAFRRVPEAMSCGILPFGIVVLTLLAWRTLSGPATWQPDGEPGTLWFKALWLRPPFVLVRGAAYIAVWTACSRWLVSLSRREDDQPALDAQRRMVRASAIFVALFAITFSLASVDWLMALEPMWYSTVWGVYQFSGLMTGGLAVLILLALHLRDTGVLQNAFTDEHQHDVGKLLFGFSCFWMYIWYCQYMLIWYAHIPEETIYFVPRLSGAWSAVFVANVVLNWGLPFLVLLPRKNKRSATVLRRVAAVVLLGRGLDLLLAVYPAVIGPNLVFGVWETAAGVGVASVTWLCLLRSFGAAPAIPLGSPFLGESLEYRT